MAEKQSDAQQGTENQQSQFTIQKVYMKDISFETPHSPEIFREEWKPAVDMQLENQANMIEDDVFDVTLSITVTVTVNDKTAYLVEIQQSGVFTIIGFAKELIEQMLATACPNILFPFAREAISDLVTRGGFPQLLLAPVNFDALYMQQIEKAKQEQQEATSTH